MADGNLAPAQNTDINPLVAGFNNLALWRQLGLMLGLAASIAIGFGVVLWSKEDNYRPLYTDLSNIDAVEVSDILQQSKIPFKFDSHQGMLLVAENKVHEARMKMAASGYSPSQGAGSDLLDKDSSFGTSQFIENARYHRSIELELAKTISSIEGVRNARVHLAIPKRSVFVGDKRKPSASVLIDLNAGRTLDKAQVSAVVHLVASSIPELSDKSVTVVDHKGNLLSENDMEEGIAQAGKQFEYSRKLEQNYIRRISNILIPILGEDRFQVEVSADVDFTQFEQASEQFNPDLPAVRSEKVIDEERGSLGVGGVPGALSNQPPADASVPQVANDGGDGSISNSISNRRSQATRNFELDRTVSHTRRQFGTLQRLSVAVVVDAALISPSDIEGAGDGGERSKEEEAGAGVSEVSTAQLESRSQTLSPEQITQLASLVKNAIGFDPSRGDTVTVIPQQFFKPEIVELQEEKIEIWEEAWFQSILKQVLAALGVLAVIFGVLRPILKNIVSSGKKDLEMTKMLGEGGDVPLGAMGSGLDENVTLSSGPDALLPSPNDHYDQQISAVKSMVSDDPRRVAQVVKSWLSNDG